MSEVTAQIDRVGMRPWSGMDGRTKRHPGFARSLVQRLMVRWPEEPGGSSVWFETDGTFVRFTLFKAYPGSRAFGDRYAPRFDTSESGGKAHWVPPPPDPKTEGEVTPAEGPLEGEAN